MKTDHPADQPIIEDHPWQPFVPDGARVLFLGTFPPGAHRWSMDFYYPNPSNDFWRIMGLIFFADKDALYRPTTRSFDLDAIRQFLTDNHIALSDTARRVRRLRGNASDKYLEILEPLDLRLLLSHMPLCHTVASTGEKAASVIAQLTSTTVPAMGAMTTDASGIDIWRMPSSSRAFPMKLERKAEFYTALLRSTGILL